MPRPSRHVVELRRALAPSGVLRATINLGNPVLAHSHSSKEKPAGVTVDLARRLGGLLQLPVEFLCFDTPARAGAAIVASEADVGFLAIDPTRAESLRFTRPYVQIEGCYLVRDTSPLQGADEVDRPGTNIVVGVGSAYALFLARELRAARLVQVPTSEEVVTTLLSNPELHVAAGVRQQLEADMAKVGGGRLLPDAFMAIRQGMVVSRHCDAGVLSYLDDFLRDAHNSGFLAESFRLHGITGATLLQHRPLGNPTLPAIIMTNDYSPSRVADRLEIQDLVYRWCRAADRLDFDAMPALFHPDAYDDHGPYRGDIPGLIEWIRERHKVIMFSMHQMTNLLIEFADEDNALVECYMAMVQRYAPGADQSLAQLTDVRFAEGSCVDLHSRSRYIDRVQRRNGEWRVLRRTLVQDWKQLVEVPNVPANRPGALVGRRDREDFIYSERSSMGIGARQA